MDQGRPVSLIVRGGVAAGAAVTIDDAMPNVTIGSDPRCQLYLPVPGIQRIHARVWCDQGVVTLYSAGNAMTVNGEPVVGERQLVPDDVIGFPLKADDDVIVECRALRPAATEPAPGAAAQRTSVAPVIATAAPRPASVVPVSAAAPVPPVVAPGPPSPLPLGGAAVAPPPRAHATKENATAASGSRRAILAAGALLLLLASGWVGWRVTRVQRPADVASPQPAPVQDTAPSPGQVTSDPPLPEPTPAADTAEVGPAAGDDSAHGPRVATGVVRPPPGTAGRAAAPGAATRPVPPSTTPAPTAHRPASAGRFVAGLTRIQPRPEQRKGIAGFESDGFVVAKPGESPRPPPRKGVPGFEPGIVVHKRPDASGVLELRVSPADAKAGDPYRLQVYLKNDGRKPIRVARVDVTTTGGGKRMGGPTPPRARQVEPGARTLVAELPSVLPTKLQGWTAAAVVTAGNGETIATDLAWRGP